MQRYTIFFIAVNALHVSGGFSAHHQELKLYTQHLVYVKLACCYRYLDARMDQNKCDDMCAKWTYVKIGT
jgi:hypothetical protein